MTRSAPTYHKIIVLSFIKEKLKIGYIFSVQYIKVWAYSWSVIILCSRRSQYDYVLTIEWFRSNHIMIMLFSLPVDQSKNVEYRVTLSRCYIVCSKSYIFPSKEGEMKYVLPKFSYSECVVLFSQNYVPLLPKYPLWIFMVYSLIFLANLQKFNINSVYLITVLMF